MISLHVNSNGQNRRLEYLHLFDDNGNDQPLLQEYPLTDANDNQQNIRQPNTIDTAQLCIAEGAHNQNFREMVIVFLNSQDEPVHALSDNPDINIHPNVANMNPCEFTAPAPGPPPQSGAPAGAAPPPGAGPNFVQTTTSIEEDHILGVAGRSGTNPPHLHLAVSIPANGSTFNPMSFLNPYASGQYTVNNIEIENTSAGSELAGRLRFEAEIDSTNRYDFDGVELLLNHNLLSQPQRISVSTLTHYPEANVRYGGIRGTTPSPNALNQDNPIWVQDPQSQTRTGIFPNPDAGQHRINYNVNSTNTHGLDTNNGNVGLIPGQNTLIVRTFSATGDQFDNTSQFTLHGPIITVVDNNSNPLQGIQSTLRCDNLGDPRNLETNQNGRFWSTVQPNQTCRVQIDENGFLPVDREINIQAGQATVETITLLREVTIEGTVQTPSGDGIEGFNITATPTSNTNQLETFETQTASDGSYSLTVGEADYDVTAEERGYIVKSPSTKSTSVNQSNSPVTVNFEAAKPGEIKATVKKKKNDGSVVYAQNETVHLSGNSAFGTSISESDGTGDWVAETLFRDVPPGDYTVSVSISSDDDQPAQNYSKSVSLESGEREEIYLGP